MILVWERSLRNNRYIDFPTCSSLLYVAIPHYYSIVPTMPCQLRPLGGLSLLLLAVQPCSAIDPPWWTASATNIKESGVTAHDYSPANLGQLKHVASQANAYLDNALAPGGGSETAVDTICQFTDTSNYSPVNIGQLKNVAKPFYDRLAQIHYNWRTGTYGVATPLYPWTSTTSPNNAAPANLGQLKNVFAFQLSSDFLNTSSDADGLKDWHEYALGLNPNDADTDHDWLTDDVEIREGTDPASATSFPPVWRSIYKSCGYTYYTSASPSYGVFTWDGNWAANLNAASPETLHTPLNVATGMITRLDANLAFPSVSSSSPLPPWLTSSSFLAVTSDAWLVNTNGSGPDGGLHHQRVWLARGLPTSSPVVRSALKVSAISIGGQLQSQTVVPITFTIPQGAFISNLIDLAPNHPPTTSDGLEYRTDVTLLQGEFKTFPDNELGPNKTHKRNLPHLAGAPYGAEWTKCVARVWDTTQTLNLVDYLDGADNSAVRPTLESALKWRVDGVEQTSHIINYGPEPDEDAHTHRFIEAVPTIGGPPTDRLVITIVPRSTKTRFDAWYVAEKANLAWLSELPPLFSWIETTVGPDGFLPRPDRNYNPFIYAIPKAISSYYHPGSSYEQRSQVATLGNHGGQACFDSSGTLITVGVRAGSADKEAPLPAQLDGSKHREADVKPFVWALQLDGNPAKGSGFPNYTELSAPMLHEGGFLKQYLEVRPPVPNAKPRLVPGSTP